MRVWVFLGGCKLTALLDSGSSKNFINTRVRLIKTVSMLLLAMGITSAAQVRLAELRGRVGGDYFWFDSRSLPMGSLDMVVGVSWTILFRDIQWNFKE